MVASGCGWGSTRRAAVKVRLDWCCSLVDGDCSEDRVVGVAVGEVTSDAACVSVVAEGHCDWPVLTLKRLLEKQGVSACQMDVSEQCCAIVVPVHHKVLVAQMLHAHFFLGGQVQSRSSVSAPA